MKHIPQMLDPDAFEDALGTRMEILLWSAGALQSPTIVLHSSFLGEEQAEQPNTVHPVFE
jgi:hypothetical protein